jgi:hypothetical protein
MAYQTLLGGIKVFEAAHVHGWNHSGVIAEGDYRGNLIPSDEDERAQYLGSHFSRVSVPAMTTMAFINVAVKPINDNGYSSPIVAELRPRNANLSYLYWNANTNYGLSELTIVPGNLDTDNRPDITNFFGWLQIIDDDDDGRIVGYQLCAYYMYSDGRSYSIIGSSNNNILNVKALEDVYNSTAGPTTSDPAFGPESEPEGYGQDDELPAFDHESTPVPIPSMPTVGVTTAGFYHAYKVTQGLLTDFGAKLFPSLSAIIQDASGITSTEDVLKLMVQLLVSPAAFFNTQIVDQNFSVIDMLINGKAIDYVIDCHVIPVSPSVGSSENIKCGAREIQIAAPKVLSDYIDFDCGSVSIPSQYTNFLDVTACRARLFLPFVGFIDLKPEFWHGGTISVKYRFNIVDGSFMAYVYCNRSKFSKLANTVIGQYGGCACLHIPVTGINYASMVSGLVTGSMSLAANVAAGKPVGIAGSAMTALNMTPELAQSNNYNSSTAFLGVRRPYLLIERGVPCMSPKYIHDKGIPLNVTRQLSAVHGFTIIDDIDLSGIGATDEEIQELKNLLAEGVYL